MVPDRIKKAHSYWDESYSWFDGGEYWSKAWGSSHMQWYGSLLPRIGTFVPTDTILEIAPGYGRWTAFLKDLCKRLIVVDFSQKCIDACRQRFADSSHIAYFVNNGRSLEMVADGSIDFVFSFDSLVHAEDVEIEAYISELAKKLRPNGAAFLHHSNLGEYIWRNKMQRQLSNVPRLTGLLKKLHVYDNDNLDRGRVHSMTAAKIASFAENHKLACVSQELITWQTRFALIDCLSIIAPRGSRWFRENRVLKNRGFMSEANKILDLSPLYDWSHALQRDDRLVG